jgi:hypothetical protein
MAILILYDGLRYAVFVNHVTKKAIRFGEPRLAISAQLY